MTRTGAPPAATTATLRPAVAVDTFKHSPALGATMALLGVKGAVPLLHGAQGCTAAAKVKLVNHFLESIPLATSAMDEVSTVLGGDENIREAIVTLHAKASPALIGVCSTALTATRGDDLAGAVRLLRRRHPELDGLGIAVVDSPDFLGGLQEGFAAAVDSLLQTFAAPGSPIPGQVTVLAGASLAPGDVQELKDLHEAFGLRPLMVPDLADSLDGHLDREATAPVAQGGVTVEELGRAGRSERLLVVGDSLLPAGRRLAERCGLPLTAVPHLMTLEAVDGLMVRLAEWSGRAVPERCRRQRRQVQDALLDTHFHFGRKQVALALESDLLTGMVAFLESTGACIQAAVTPRDGDLALLESRCGGADLLVASSQAVDLAERRGVTLCRMGFPIVDRLGQGLRVSIGYAGLLRLLIDLGNQLLEQELALSHRARPGTPCASDLPSFPPIA